MSYNKLEPLFGWLSWLNDIHECPLDYTMDADHILDRRSSDIVGRMSIVIPLVSVPSLG